MKFMCSLFGHYWTSWFVVWIEEDTVQFVKKCKWCKTEIRRNFKRPHNWNEISF